MVTLKFDISDIQAIYRDTRMNGENFAVAERFVTDLVLPKVQGNDEWTKDFYVEGAFTPLPEVRGYATYQALGYKRRPVVLLDAHAPMSEVSQEDTATYEGRMGSIPQFARGLFDNALSMEILESIAKTQGAKEAMEQFTNGMSRLVGGLDATATRLAHQKMTYGKCMANWGNGIQWELESILAADHFLTAGDDPWNDTSCDIPAQWAAKYEAIREELGDPDWVGVSVVDEKYARETIATNPAMVAAVNKYLDAVGNRNVTYVSVSDGDASFVPTRTGAISLKDLADYSRSEFCGFPPIEYRNAKQFTSTIAGGYNNWVGSTGWKDGAVVIKPAGFAGVIKKAKVRDIELLRKHIADGVKASYTSIKNGLGWVLNVEGKDGLLAKHSTKLFASFIPELTEWQEHFVIDTKTAD